MNKVKNVYFDKVEQKVDFPTMEKKILDGWEKNGIVNKYLHKNDASQKYFSFLDGPITANNPMGVHHAWGRTYKDLWQRYKNMQGYRQRFQNGFDCQGLWVEVEVEKELGLKSKKDIENLVPGDKKASIAKFVELCKERVKKYSKIQTEQSKRLGYFMDWENSYFTMSDENNYMIWHFLKKCADRDLIYKGHDVVPWCPRCETAISQHEMLTEDYKETTHESIFIEYPVEGKENTFLLAWTTTPWTLPGNVAVAVDPKKDYVEAEGELPKNTYILIKEAAERLNLKIKKTFKGSDIVGLNYKSPFDELPRVKESLGSYKHKVIATDSLILPVSVEEGTGIVHIAPGQGSEDYQLGKKEKLPVIELINDQAFYLDSLGEFSNQSGKKHPEIIIEFIKAKDCLFKTQKYTHRYPACWRCKTELVWKITDEWYIAMDKGTPSLREQMVSVAKKIKWLPEFGLERELDWLKNMHDWLISKKNRYWGLALPIWECSECHSFELVGSKEELEKKATSGFDSLKGKTPHKPWIDEVKIKCSKCGAKTERIADVGNPWLDAGIVTYSTISKDNKSEPLYLSNRDQWKKWAPADFITESFPGQFKNWFYSLIAMSAVLEGMEPTKTVLGFAIMVDEKGNPFHKSAGNAIEFIEAADTAGADVIRFFCAGSDPSQNGLFGYKNADEVRRRFFLKLWNIYNFFVTYANLDGWQPAESAKSQIESANVLDRWIMARLNDTINTVTISLDGFDAYNATGAIDKFVDDFSLWYVRRSRDRVGPAADNPEDKNAFYETSYFVLHTLTRILAPFTPFIAEEIFKNLTKEESVHLTAWPEAKSLDKSETTLLKEMAIVRSVVETAHAARKKTAIPVRQPLKSYMTDLRKISADLEYLIRDEVNVKNIIWGAPKSKLDTVLYPELEEEMKVRELVRRIQEERKNMGLSLSQKVSVSSPWLPSDNKLKDWLMKKAQVASLSQGEFDVKSVEI